MVFRLYFQLQVVVCRFVPSCRYLDPAVVELGGDRQETKEVSQISTRFDGSGFRRGKRCSDSLTQFSEGMATIVWDYQCPIRRGGGCHFDIFFFPNPPGFGGFSEDVG